uniref:Chemokine interleukin-8-like domain-containing protein n=1 Tax=Oryzias latipes TaxID=8090 RepID=A0A3P9IU55_ORYLA
MAALLLNTGTNLTTRGKVYFHQVLCAASHPLLADVCLGPQCIMVVDFVLKCQCLRTSKTVQPSLIKKVQEFPPRPYCSKLEIIVTLKNNVKVCLDPTHKFAKAVLQSRRV